MRTLLLALAGLAAGVVLAACGFGGGSGAQTRDVLVDYVHDELASSFLYYFPRDVTVRPGDTVRFRQEWTGEPHSVTAGTMVDDMMNTLVPLFEQYADVPEEEIPPEAFQTFEEALGPLPFMLPETFEAGLHQGAAQPCYLDEGAPPEETTVPCEQQEKPEFTGRHSYYSSGFIPYQGPQGNEFTMTLADDIEPGTYYYYCNVHGPFQYGSINVVEPDSDIPSQDEVSRQAREEIETAVQPLLEAFEQLQQGNTTLFGQEFTPPVAGWAAEEPDLHAFTSEFYPEELRVGVGETITWEFVGGHTVSFGVPDYFSEIVVEDDGTVVFSEEAFAPVNSPGYPEPPEPGGPPGGEGAAEGAGGEVPPQEEGEEAPPEGPPEEPPPPVEVDGGTWDGESFKSSGIFWDGRYSLTFERAGTYRYACLIHPQMVGTVIVE